MQLADTLKDQYRFIVIFGSMTCFTNEAIVRRAAAAVNIIGFLKITPLSN